MRPSSQRSKRTVPTKVTLHAQGRFLKVSAETDEERTGGGLRGKVNPFSRASRLRLLSYMHKIKPMKGGNFHATFITLTYGQSFPTPSIAKHHLDNFLKRLKRRWAYCSGFWRFEFQQRGAPHFHLVLFGLPFLPKDTLKKWWGEVVGQQFWDTSTTPRSAPFTRIEALQSHAHAVRYISKYVAKVDDSGFNFLAYLTDKGEFIHPVTGEIEQSIGRWWGVFNSIWLPLAAVKEMVIKWGSRDVFYNLRRAAGSLWKGRNNHAKSGWTYFTDNPYEWLRYAEYLEKERWL